MDSWNPATILYVVDKRQEFHFKSLFSIARRWGYDKIALEHISFGSVLDVDKKPLKAREGDAVYLEDLLDEIRRTGHVCRAGERRPGTGRRRNHHGTGRHGKDRSGRRLRSGEVRRSLPESHVGLCLLVGQDADDRRQFGDVHAVRLRSEPGHFAEGPCRSAFAAPASTAADPRPSDGTRLGRAADSFERNSQRSGQLSSARHLCVSLGSVRTAASTTIARC